MSDIEASRPAAQKDDAQEFGAESEEALAGYARYRHLRANVRKRRSGYKLFILLAILVFAGSIADILFLYEKDFNQKGPGDIGVIELVVYCLYAILFVWAVLLLLSRKRASEEQEELKQLERTLLQCPDCKNVFQYGEIHFEDHQKTAFSCPVCGIFSTLPGSGADAIKAVAPEGDLREFAYHCTHCDEDIRVGTFGDQPIHVSKFRACPHCGEKGYIERIALPAEEYAGDPGAAPA